MAGDVEEKEFAKFRPHCLVLASTPNKAVLDKLAKLVDDENPEVLENLQSYLMFPMQLYLKTPILPDNYTIAVLVFIRTYFKKTRLLNFFILKDILGSCLVMIGKSDSTKISKEAPTEVSKGEGGMSEDLKVNICECLEKLLLSSDQTVLSEFFSESSKLSLSHLVFTCLAWAEKDKAAVVKSSCISLINSVCSSFSSLPSSSQSTNLLLSVLPGILSKLVKVTQDTSVLQTKVKIQAVETWTLYVKTLINDRTLSDAQQLTPENPSTSLLANPKWTDNALNQISSQIKILHDLSFHSHPSLRDSLADLSITLCQTSWSAISSSFPTLLDILVALSVDEREEIRVKSTKGLDFAVEKVRDEDRMETVCARTNQSLFDLSKEVGRCLGLYQQEKLGRSIALLKGNLILLNRIEEESVFFISKVHLRCLVHSLIKVAELDETHHVLTGGAEDFSTLEFLVHPELYLTCKRPEKNFVHLTTPTLVRSVTDICSILGSCDSFYIVVEYLLEGIKELDRYQREAVILLNEVINGALNDDIDEAVIDTCLNVVNTYLSITPGVNQTALSKFEPENQRSVTINEDWTVISLIIEGLGKLVTALGDDLSIYLPIVLTYIMTHTDLSNRHATHVFYFGLKDISNALHKDIVHVLTDNVDHLTKDLNLLLRKQELGPCLPTLLKVVLKVSAADQDMSDLQDTVESLMKNLAMCEGTSTIEILTVIRIFVFSFKQKIVKKPEGCDKPSEKENDDIGSVTKMIQNLELDRAAEAKIVEELDNPRDPCPEEGFHDENPPEDNEPLEDEPVNPGPTEHQIFLKSVLDNVKNFVSMAGQPSWQLAALDIVTCCLDLLASTPGQLPGDRQEQLLPLVHDLWHPLKLLFKSNNIFIVDKAFECLVVIADHARDFVHKRTVTDVFPPLLNFFQTLQVMVGDRDRQTTLAATQSRRILSRLVSGLWNFLHLLDLGPLESDPLVDLLLDHLGDKLGSGETQFLKPKRNLDRNILWLKLNCKEQ